MFLLIGGVLIKREVFNSYFTHVEEEIPNPSKTPVDTGSLEKGDSFNDR